MRAGVPIIGLMIVAIFGALAIALGVALAQEDYVSTSSNPTDELLPSSELSPEESAILGNALTFGPSTLNNEAPVKPLRLPRLSSPNNLDVSRANKPDGSSTVMVKQRLPIDLDAKVGADLDLAANTPDGYQPGKSRAHSGSGAAWASVGVLPNLATVDARVDPSNDQGKLGTTFQHSLPLGSKFSVTLKNSYSVTETFSGSSVAAAINSTLPVPQVWGNEKAAKFNILPTGTTLGAGLASASNDPVTHRTLSAEQKLYGPLQVTTAVTDIGQPISNKSISARFKLNW